MANICRGLRKKFFSSPVLKSPTHIGFIGVKKNGSKISHLGTFKCFSHLHFKNLINLLILYFHMSEGNIVKVLGVQYTYPCIFSPSTRGPDRPWPYKRSIFICVQNLYFPYGWGPLSSPFFSGKACGNFSKRHETNFDIQKFRITHNLDDIARNIYISGNF
jgi:hypothetical protein